MQNRYLIYYIRYLIYDIRYLIFVVVVVVVLLFYVHGKNLRSCQDGQLTSGQA